ncbi:MAG: YihA family ribosome biogenesis GTP-binding protein [Firmicutes bacterium HGW-Firmicutes-13]|nr:MAG: YihA family ribosome biogenesis GTP-binding protein [Firmicutes bacterium HGW-Firmicutes-13]
MQVKSVEFVKKAADRRQFPPGELPEVAFCGRSNVGKSSLINALLGRKKLAPTSGQPGKTRTIDFYIINQKFYLVDLPGYGFARVSKDLKHKWGRLIESYLKDRPQLKSVVLIIDIRHEPAEDDLLMYDWLKFHEVATIIVATKKDKLSRGRALQHIKRVKEKLQPQPGDLIITFSARTGEGKNELWEKIREVLSK